MGFVFNEEFSAEWPHLQQTRVLVFHSWIAEYANIGNITGLSDSFIPSFYSILTYNQALHTRGTMFYMWDKPQLASLV